ncbi:DUF2231 domain-containing protein [Spectribacter hydrogenooxidans]|uniref:DUF2231 domain-containing protein n=1 Tax=Spectribacter hydrogenoxidans TaxID=3075608 RepID=A0ABU3C3X5_9GAMM|nr:DUF2231 domain-containing protein [Salinisphaera sp. W335]MDT0636272.1 DUF2231 domain-containing protein [Salinisphaera sp. W335]
MHWPRHFLGLPLHPMLVHFPLAFWLALPILDLAALVYGIQPWWGLALGVNAVAVVIGLAALISGLLEYVHLSESGSNDVRLAARHGVRTTVVWCVMTLKLAVASFASPGASFIAACLAVDLLACALLLQAAFFGTRITYGSYGR